MTAKFPPLPKSLHGGDCPWCKRDIFTDPNTGLDLPSRKCKNMFGRSACPWCNKAILVTAPGWSVTDFDDLDPDFITIRPERSETDKRYMAQMGLKDPE